MLRSSDRLWPLTASTALALESVAFSSAIAGSEASFSEFR